MKNKITKIIKNIQNELEKYITENKIKAFICGISGGIDSCVTVALAEEVCKTKNISLIGRSLPIMTNKKNEIERAELVGNAFCTDFAEKDLSNIYTTFHQECEFNNDEIDDLIRKGNIKARIRMIYLYDLARQHNGLVLSTDNLTELLLGFWTLHGDVGDLGMLQNLWKTEVYAIAEHLYYEESAKYLVFKKSSDIKVEALKKCIDATPTDGLGITNSDIEQLGVKSYDEADTILKSWLKEQPDEYKNHSIIQRYQRTHFKRNNPYNFSRDLLFEGIK